VSERDLTVAPRWGVGISEEKRGSVRSLTVAVRWGVGIPAEIRGRVRSLTVAVRWGVDWSLIDDEEACSGRRSGSVRLVAIAYLIAGSGSQGEGSAVGKFGDQLAFETQKNVSFLAPMVGEIAGRILHHADADVAEGLRAPQREAGISGMRRRRDLIPGGGRERGRKDLHRALLLILRPSERFDAQN